MPVLPHEWDLTPKEAVKVQLELASSVVKESHLARVKNIVGVDASYMKGWAYAAAVAFSYPELELVEYTKAQRRVSFPYVPGLLSFREGPVVLEALDKLKVTPGLLIFDAHGVAHPRRFGIASHIGVILGLPSIGCAKTRLCGKYEEPGLERGRFSYLVDRRETIGVVLRTRRGVKPVFVSIGNRIDLVTSVKFVLDCCRGYRFPEPTRWADKLASGKAFDIVVDAQRSSEARD